MERTRESLARVRTWPALAVLGLMAWLFAPILIEGLRAPEYWLRVQTFEVAPTQASTSPVLTVDRHIVRPFLANWDVIVRRQEATGWVVSCTARGGGNYRTDAVLPDDLTLAWWTNGQCQTLAPGAYQIATVWSIYPRGGVTKRLSVESNIFEVMP